MNWADKLDDAQPAQPVRKIALLEVKKKPRKRAPAKNTSIQEYKNDDPRKDGYVRNNGVTAVFRHASVLSPIIPRYINVECLLMSKNRANFVGVGAGEFYDCLCKLREQHQDLVTDCDGSYNSPFDTRGFKFKAAGQYLRCYFADDKQTLTSAANCYGRLVRLNLFVRPYAYETNVGLSIQVARCLVL